MEEKKEDKNKLWRPVFLFYGKTTIWIIGPLLIGLFLGGYLREVFEKQIYFILSVFIAFFVTIFGIYKEIKEYKETLNK
jgi:hypothetical protein